MKKTCYLLPLFRQFIRESENGKRRKQNGERIKSSTIKTYLYVYKNLLRFSEETDFELRIADAYRLTKREFESERNYWKKFYVRFTNWLYKRGCHDNYVGNNIKHFRTFINYLKKDKNLSTGEFHRKFYVRKEEIPVLVLNPEQLKFLIQDKSFEQNLSASERRIKDIFIFGCITGLRFSDIFRINRKNFECKQGELYFRMRSSKTKTYSNIKLPEFAISVFNKYKSRSYKKELFEPISLFNFNKHLKSIGEKAGWTFEVSKVREKLGKEILLQNGNASYRFYDLMSSHMMRRTAITTMLILGMPENLVRKLSGHTAGSSSFHRYVHFAQAYIDQEITKFHEKLIDNQN